jgi:hypothetical protein
LVSGALGIFGQAAVASVWQAGEGQIERRFVAGQAAKDHFAMSGRACDVIFEWAGATNQAFSSSAFIRWPMLRTLPDDTHAALKERFRSEDEPRPFVDGRPLSEGRAERAVIDGTFRVSGRFDEGLAFERITFPSVSSPALITRVELQNIAGRPLAVSLPAWRQSRETKPGVFGVYCFDASLVGSGTFRLQPGEKAVYGIVRAAREKGAPPYWCELEPELAARRALVASLEGTLALETPDPLVNLMFRFAKLHASESIFATRGGLMHAPGGYNSYLAAIWANDQAEYVSPFFPFLGYATGNVSALSCYRLFARYMNPEYTYLPWSIIAEGRDVYGKFDRGDAAMIAHGASRFALAAGSREQARELLPLIRWCLEYCRRMRLPEGVVASKSDELEGRFPSGVANLNTSTLCYDGLLRAADLLDALGEDPAGAAAYRQEAQALRAAIAAYFSATVEGFETYRYYAGNDKLRSWICIPLVFGLDERKQGTIDALFSDRLWTGNGMLTQSGEKTYWDRSALYAFRGIFRVGAQDRALPYLTAYVKERLTGQHVPYAIEAWPEFNQSHLSAESGLFCRIFTEGLFGITPTGLDRFECLPRLPSGWKRATLRNMSAFGCRSTLELERTWRGKIRLRVASPERGGAVFYDAALPEGEAHRVSLTKEGF